MRPPLLLWQRSEAGDRTKAQVEAGAIAPMFRRMIEDRKLPARRTRQITAYSRSLSRSSGHEPKPRKCTSTNSPTSSVSTCCGLVSNPNLAEALLDHCTISMGDAPAWNVRNAAVRTPLLVRPGVHAAGRATRLLLFRRRQHWIILLNQFIDTGPVQIARKDRVGHRSLRVARIRITRPSDLPWISPKMWGCSGMTTTSTGSGRSDATCIDIAGDIDTITSTMLQFINAHENIYFMHETLAGRVRTPDRTHARAVSSQVVRQRR